MLIDFHNKKYHTIKHWFKKIIFGLGGKRNCKRKAIMKVIREGLKKIVELPSFSSSWQYQLNPV